MDKKKILIVDDEPDLVQSLQTHLDGEIYQCAAAYDGRSGLRYACIWKPNLIILDIMLPDISGYRISQRMKFHPEYKAYSHHHAQCQEPESGSHYR
ncbi:MAG: response regulator [Deltaproteobacteria bacterium]|nr:MAG: response regulator [Deltaproteobacteria bacterium]